MGIPTIFKNFFEDPPRYCHVHLYFEPYFYLRVQALWWRYASWGDGNKMLMEGVSQFLADLQLEPMSRAVLILAWQFNAQTQCEFTFSEFLSGMLALGCDSIDELRTRCSSLEDKIQHPMQFKILYYFTFYYAKSPEQTGLDQETAIAYWTILLADRFKFFDLWCEFLLKYPQRSISEDTWHTFIEFCNMINDDMSNHDASELWPVLIADFVDFARPIVQGRGRLIRRCCKACAHP